MMSRVDRNSGAAEMPGPYCQLREAIYACGVRDRADRASQRRT